MREQMEQIIKTRWLFVTHIILYLCMTMINAAALLDSKNQVLGQYRVHAIVFTCVFLVMFLVEVVAYIGVRRILQNSVIEFWYRIIQITIFCIAHFMTPIEIGSGIIMLAIVVSFVELVFFFQPDDTGRRIMTYICMAIVLEVLAVWFVLASETFYEGVNLFISTSLLFVVMLALSETIIRVYYHFMRKLFA